MQIILKITLIHQKTDSYHCDQAVTAFWLCGLRQNVRQVLTIFNNRRKIISHLDLSDKCQP